MYEYFVATGMLNASCDSSAYVHGGFTPASSEDIVQSWKSEINFASKTVQSVGYENLPLSSDDEKPAVIGGFPVRYRRLTPLSVKPDNSRYTTNIPFLYRCPSGELACGSSCALSTQNSAGTMGALLKLNGDDEQLYVLSNNHVIGGCNHAEKDAIINVPAHIDSQRFASLEVGNLSSIIPLESGNPAFVQACDVDAAIGRITYPDRVTSWQGTLSEGYARLRKLSR